MSIEAAPQLTPQEVDTQIGHLEHQITGENIATIVDAVVTKVVPNSVEMAEQVVDRLEVLDAAVRQDTSANPGLKAELGEEYVEDLHQTALKGLDNWRLSKAERSEWAQVVGSHSHHLSPKMRSIMHDLSPENSNDTDTQMFARLRRQAHDRLKLDAALEAKYGNDDHARPVETAAADPAAETPKYRQLPALDEKPKFDQRVYKNNAKHIYAIDENGKKHHVSADSILAAYGHAGDFQGKRPVEAVADTDTTSANDDDLVMPATYRDKAAWDKKTDAEKRRTIVTAEMIAADEVARRSQNTPPSPLAQRIARIRAEQKALENDPIYQRIVAKVETDANAKTATLADYYDGDITAISKMTPGQRIQVFRKASLQAKKDGKELLVMPESYGGTKLMSDFYAMSKDKQRRVIRADKLITQDRIEQAERLAAMGRQKQTLRDLGYSAMRFVDDGIAAVAKRYHEIDKSKRRKAVVGLLAASVALTGIGLAQDKDDVLSKVHSTTVSLNEPHDVAGRRAALAEIRLKNLDDTKKDDAIEKARSVKLHAGDTIWDESKVHLTKGGNRHPSNAQVTEEMHRVMQLNHISEDGARHLPVGKTIKF